MKRYFQDILTEKNVDGILFCSLDGKVLAVQANDATTMKNFQSPDFLSILGSHRLKTVQEIELIFDRKKMYLKHLSTGILCVIMDVAASMPMIRLNCDMIQMQLKEKSMKKGFRQLFSR
jgi:hypothetical protein